MKKIVFLAAAVALLAMSTAAQAQNLSPGGNTPTGVIPFVDPEAGGTIIQSVSAPFSFGGAGGTLDQGTVKEEVIQSTRISPTNGLPELDFLYQVSVTAGNIQTLGVADYTGFTTNVSQESNVTGLTNQGSNIFTNGTFPTSFDSRTSNGDTVNFNFASLLLPGQTSYVQIIQTNATSYTSGTIELIDSGVYGPTFGFFAPNPEPSSLVLFGGLALGLGGAGLRRWRKRKAVSA